MGCNASHHQQKDREHVWDVTEDAPSQNGRIVIVTGANSGVGEVTVEYMLQKGATVVMACRNPKRAKAASKDILDRVAKHEKKLQKAHKSTGDSDSHSDDSDHHERVTTATGDTVAAPRSYAQAVRVGLAGTPPASERLFIEELDLNDFASIRRFSQRVEQRVAPFNLGQVDTLILNAGVMNVRKLEKSVDGFERQWQTNFLGHFLLVGELMPSLRRSLNQPVVVPVSSVLAHHGHLSKDSAFDFGFENEWKGKYSSEQVYDDTKLAAILFATELRNRHGDWLRVIPCHPGVCRTRLFRHSIYTIFKPSFQPASQGAALEMRAATDTSLQNGTYIGTGGGWSGKPIEEAPGAQGLDAETSRALWEAAERAVGFSY